MQQIQNCHDSPLMNKIKIRLLHITVKGHDKLNQQLSCDNIHKYKLVVTPTVNVEMTNYYAFKQLEKTQHCFDIMNTSQSAATKSNCH